MARCFVTREVPGPALQRLRDAHDVDVWPGRMPPSPDELAARAAGAHGLLTMLTERVDAALLGSLPELRAIANYAVGYDNIDVEAASARGIAVGNTPDVLTDATADLAFALLMAAARELPAAAAAVRDGEWRTWEPGRFLGAEVHGATLGIIGLGRIGRAVAQRARGFEMEVIHASARRRSDGAPGSAGAGTGSGSGSDTGTSLAELLERSDFVSLHCPLTPETHHLIDAEALAAMRESAILINTARGPIVDQDALRVALASGEIAGAALDVTDPEPLPADDPLLSAPNLIVVPHIGSATRAAREKMTELAVENLLAGLDGRPMPHQVN